MERDTALETKPQSWLRTDRWSGRNSGRGWENREEMGQEMRSQGMGAEGGTRGERRESTGQEGLQGHPCQEGTDGARGGGRRGRKESFLQKKSVISLQAPHPG